MDWSTTLILRPKFMIVHFFILWLDDWKKYILFIEFQLPNNQMFFFGGHSTELLITKWLNVFLKNYRWLIFDHPINGKVDPHNWFGNQNSFGHVEEVKKQITKKNWLLKFFSFSITWIFPIFGHCFTCHRFFPIIPLFLIILSRFWFKLALSWRYFDVTLGCVNIQNDVSCCDELNNAMTTLGSYVHNTFVRFNIKHIGDKNLNLIFFVNS
jgi:hypothetical protein